MKTGEQMNYVYLLTNRPRGTLYIGVTSCLTRRLTQHQKGHGSLFVKKYNLTRLVHVEPYTDIRDAIAREKQLKKWNRGWKIELIEQGNPRWADLSGLMMA